MEDKEEFLKEFGDYYGYPNGPKTIDEIRATEFKRLEDTVYLDHAGATLYSELQMESIFKDLTTSVYGNPHSQSDSSSATSNIVREARQQVLDYCNASPKDYKCIFTSGATAALKLIGENFPWSCQSTFMYTMENHNSVLGIREYALNQGAAAFAVDIKEAVDQDGASINSVTSVKLSQYPVQRRNEAEVLEGELTGDAYNLFAFPSECNFSGLRFSLDLVNNVKQNTEKILEGSPYSKGRWMVIIDAAKGFATKPPNLSLYPADFVVISFYKLFGYPTGLGALIIKNDAAKLLKKTYFSGGTVSASIADIDFVRRRESVEENFEDGSISFLSIASICHGFKIFNNLTPAAMHRHTMSIVMFLKKKLLALRHENGASVCTLYGNHTLKVSSSDSGSIVSFNVKRPDGSWFGYREVEKLASLSGIQLRAGHVCWDDKDVINGKPTGAVRVSFGYMSTYEDAKKFIDFIRSSFVSMPSEFEKGYLLRANSVPYPTEGFENRLSSSGCYLKSITIYPIKSCAGFSVKSWPLSTTGLQYDREWLLKSLTGEILTQKKVPEMSLINTFINLNQKMLSVESPRCEGKLQIKLDSDSYLCGKEEFYLHSQRKEYKTIKYGLIFIYEQQYGNMHKCETLFKKRYEVQCYENEINQWFSNAVGQPCTLVRCCHSQYYLSLNKNRSMGMCRDVDSRMNFANEAQFLLISEESVSDLNDRLCSNTQKLSGGAPLYVKPMRFRPNLVISGGEPYAEDGWRNLKIGNTYFTSLGGCNRCQMINFYHQTGQVKKTNEPLATLASYRRVKGKILFGILLRYDPVNGPGLDAHSWLKVGEEVYPNSE
ncbi:molybdenum cofactor sulfurase-like isoform X3 [Durio zibethinus]|uniref:Molybdenum cofactor sulfurase n=1 Tax=Durio zibethinus TaxID=66656 RepID=A0A6P5WP07_DURZI|nr:molybdenum cofactor sulfurase-like isoform X3 [Durio zibethinus]